MRTIGLKPGDAVLVIERRDGREFVHTGLAIGISMEPELVGQHGEMSIDAVLVPPAAWGSEMRFVTMAHLVHLSHPQWVLQQVRFAYEALPLQSGVCIFCGCTELRPCVDGNGDACSWMDSERTVCSSLHCLEKLGDEMERIRAMDFREGRG